MDTESIFSKIAAITHAVQEGDFDRIKEHAMTDIDDINQYMQRLDKTFDGGGEIAESGEKLKSCIENKNQGCALKAITNIMRDSCACLIDPDHPKKPCRPTFI